MPCHRNEEEVALHPMTTGAAKFIQTIFRYILALALCLTILAVFMPLDPSMPAPGLDGSWMFAMNQGVAQGLVFGKEMVFTFGPYASIYTGLYHPDTDRLMIWGSLFLGLSYALLMLLLGKGEDFYGLLLYGIFLACLMDSRDALLFSYPLILAVVVYRMTLPDDHAKKLFLATPHENSVALLFAPLGLLPLIKGSLLPICGITAVFCSGMFWNRRNKALAYLTVSISAISCVLLWGFSGQPVLALPSYFWSMRQMISGYTEAMSLPGDAMEYILYVLASALILLVVAWTVHAPRISKWFLFVSYGLFLFTAFKAGFIRHDPGHNVVAGSSIFFAALLLMFVLGKIPSLLPLAMAVLVWTYIGHGAAQTTASDVSNNLRSTFERSFQGARTRLRKKGGLREQYDERLAVIRREFPIPRMSGTTDIYSSNQSLLFASGNIWAPRPIPQSYSVYTPELAELNLRHLQSSDAPDNIIFRVEPIDNRLPSLEDGLSWPSLINGYSLQKLDEQSAYLRKKATVIKDVAGVKDDFYNARHELGEEVSLPEANDPLFATVEITPTLLGRVFGALYKQPRLYISMRLRDGRVIKYRVISNMMKTDFLLTPLVENAREFALLGAGGNKYLAGKEVKSITISSEDRKGRSWNAAYSLKLRKLNLSGNTDLENSSLFDKMSDAAPGSLSPPSTQVCDGVIEAVNGSPPRSGIATVGNSLSVNGWLAVAGKDGMVPDHVFVTLTSEGGKTIYARAHSTPRIDVKEHFNQPGMPDPGYAAMMDVSALSGRYTLGLARTYMGNLGICRQFKLPFLIAR
jgi:hypothetical protein